MRLLTTDLKRNIPQCIMNHLNVICVFLTSSLTLSGDEIFEIDVLGVSWSLRKSRRLKYQRDGLYISSAEAPDFFEESIFFCSFRTAVRKLLIFLLTEFTFALGSSFLRISTNFRYAASRLSLLW
uniref:Uncharacterized protein n=1 Tax=Cacopsylla melanoneura TaxID=428564 RepID=A0A8D8VUX7_9HEMI